MSEIYTSGPTPSPLTDEQLEWMKHPVGGTTLMYAASYEISLLREDLAAKEAENAALRAGLDEAVKALEAAGHELTTLHNLDASDDPERGFLNAFVIDTGKTNGLVEAALAKLKTLAKGESK